MRTCPWGLWQTNSSCFIALCLNFPLSFQLDTAHCWIMSGEGSYLCNHGGKEKISGKMLIQWKPENTGSVASWLPPLREVLLLRESRSCEGKPASGEAPLLPGSTARKPEMKVKPCPAPSWEAAISSSVSASVPHAHSHFPAAAQGLGSALGPGWGVTQPKRAPHFHLGLPADVTRHTAEWSLVWRQGRPWVQRARVGLHQRQKTRFQLGMWNCVVLNPGPTPKAT